MSKLNQGQPPSPTPSAFLLTPWVTRACRVAWLGLVLLLTAALLRPEPALAAKELLPTDAEYPAAKAVHISAYALLVVLLALSRWPRVVTGVGLGLLSLHAVGTEIGQRFVPGRYGSVGDVGYDHLGLGIGLLLAWLLCWRRSDGRRPPPSLPRRSP